MHMLSVHLEVLEEVQSLLAGESQKLYEIEERMEPAGDFHEYVREQYCLE